MKRTMMMLCAAAALTACDPDDAETRDRASEDVEAPEALEDHVSRVFEELDADGNGALSPAEVEGHRLAHKFEGADVDASGDVTREELSAFMREMHEKHGGEGHHGKGHHGKGHHGDGKMGPHKSPEEHARHVMEMLDADGDGAISVEEAAEKSHLADRFGELDADQNGRLTEQELVEHHRQKRAAHP